MNHYYSGFMYSLIFVVGALTGAAVLYLNYTEILEQLLPAFITAISTLLAAYFGAKFAFQYQTQAQIKLETERQKTNASKTVLKLVEMVNHLGTYEKQFLISNKEAGPFKFIAIMPTDTKHMNVSVDEYDIFFLCQGDNVNTLAEFSMAKSTYFALINAIDERSLLHKEVQFKINARGISDMSLLSVENIKTIVGDKDFHTLNSLTDQIIPMVPETINRLNKIILELNKQIKAHFPKTPIYSVDMSKYDKLKQ